MSNDTVYVNGVEVEIKNDNDYLQYLRNNNKIVNIYEIIETKGGK